MNSHEASSVKCDSPVEIYAFDFQFAFHSINREMDFAFQFLDSTDAVIGSGFRDNAQNIAPSTSGPWPVSFDVSDVTLAADEAYSLRLAFLQNGNSVGLSTRAGFDNLSLTGDNLSNIPLPAGLPLVLTGLAALALLRRLRRAESG